MSALDKYHPLDPLAEELAQVDGESWWLLDTGPRERYRALAETALDWDEQNAWPAFVADSGLVPLEVVETIIRGLVGKKLAKVLVKNLRAQLKEEKTA
jgi:hypothetical protein